MTIEMHPQKTKEIRTTCPYCGVGCGILATPDGAGGMSIKGDPEHPANKARLCSKGAALGETTDLQGRLLHPMIAGERASWDAALDLVASKFKNTIAEHGSDSVAFYVSGQMLTEDYYVANKLMKGFIGSANIDTNSRLCMASTVAGQRRAFGTDTVPGVYEDLELADLIVIVGSNLAWCHPVLYQRIIAAKAERPKMKIINIDPRLTATSHGVDLHLSIAPDADVALFNILLAEIDKQNALDKDFVSQHVSGYDAAITMAQEAAISGTGLSPEEVETFLKLWVGTEKVVTVFSQGVNQSENGTDKVNAILNCHLATGRIGRPGMGPFSVTGQPNAMGGREVGGLANMLACHLDIENDNHRTAVADFWNAPRIAKKPGLKAVDMFRAVKDKKIKALWIICTNPAVSLPELNNVASAISKCDFVAVSDLSGTTDTALLADVLLPATGWGEKNGTVTNSERCISRQRAILPTPGETRHDWEILAEIGRRMGWKDAFDYKSAAEIFREHAELSNIAKGFGLDFDLSEVASITDEDYEGFEPTHWPISDNSDNRFFTDGRFFTANKKANMLPLKSAIPGLRDSKSYPYHLNTGRIRDQWHTMTRTGKSPRLSRHLAEPFVEIHPDDADKLGLRSADLAILESRFGQVILRVLITERVQLGQVFSPMHWTAEFAPSGCINKLVNAKADPVSGQPASKSTAVQIKPFRPSWYGFAVSINPIHPKTDYWAKAKIQNGWQVELGHSVIPEDWQNYATKLLNYGDCDITVVEDKSAGTSRIALSKNGVLNAALFVGSDPVPVSRNYIAGLLGHTGENVLAGSPCIGVADPGTTLCACLNVGANTILSAIESEGLTSVDQVGRSVGAGTSCGSCRSEIATLLQSVRSLAAAQ